MDEAELEKIPETPTYPILGVVAGTFIAILLSSLFLSYLGVAIGAAIGVRIDSSKSMGRALGIGILTGALSGVFAALLIATVLPGIYASNAQAFSSQGKNVTAYLPIATTIVEVSAVVLYSVAGFLGALISKAVWVKESPKKQEVIPKGPEY